MKKDMIEWVLWNSERLIGHKFYCTGTTNIINNIQQLYKKQENDCMSLSSSLFARLSTVASRLSSNKVSVAEHSPQISMPTTRSFRRTIASNSSSSCRLKDP